MLYHLVKQEDEVDVDEDVIMKKLQDTSLDDKTKKQLYLRSKVTSVARINRMYTTLREESEMLLKIKNISPDGKLPRGILMEGKPAIKNGKWEKKFFFQSARFLTFFLVLKQFQLAKELDKVNEKRPQRKWKDEREIDGIYKCASCVQIM